MGKCWNGISFAKSLKVNIFKLLLLFSKFHVFSHSTYIDFGKKDVLF